MDKEDNEDNEDNHEQMDNDVMDIDKANVESIETEYLYLKKYEKRKLCFIVPQKKEFYAIIKKLCVIQSLSSTKVLCAHCVPGGQLSKQLSKQLSESEYSTSSKNNNKNEKYMLFYCSLTESTCIENDYPEFNKFGIFGKWILNEKNELEFLQKVTNLQLLSSNENMFKNYYIKYF